MLRHQRYETKPLIYLLNRPGFGATHVANEAANFKFDVISAGVEDVMEDGGGCNAIYIVWVDPLSEKSFERLSEFSRWAQVKGGTVYSCSDFNPFWIENLTSQCGSLAHFRYSGRLKTIVDQILDKPSIRRPHRSDLGNEERQIMDH